MVMLSLLTSYFFCSESEFRGIAWQLTWMSVSHLSALHWHLANSGVLAMPHTVTTLLPTFTVGSANSNTFQTFKRHILILPHPSTHL